MPDAPTNLHHPATPPDWNPALPEKVPGPSVWPAVLALAVTFCLWGLISSFIITLVGIGLFILALARWIGEIRHERRTH